MSKLYVEPKDNISTPEGLKVYLNESIGKTDIDSLKLRIPYEDVIVINYDLVDKMGVYNCDTGEPVDKEKAKPRNWFVMEKLNKAGKKLYSHKYRIEYITGSKGFTSSYLSIGLNSKILEQPYFQGIRNENVRLCYDRLMSDKVVSFSYDSFLDSVCTDVDFKKDFLIQSRETFSQAMKHLTEASKEYKQANKGVNPINKPKNQGIEWATRKTATSSYCFLKIYNKAVQCAFDENMNTFYNEYLKDGTEQVENRIRIEFTIKSKKGFSRMGIESHRLRDLLNLTQEKKDEMNAIIVKQHLGTRIVEARKLKEGLSTQESTYYGLMSGYVNNTNLGKFDIINLAVENIQVKQRKSEMKSKLSKLFDSYIKPREKAKENESISNLFDALNWA